MTYPEPNVQSFIAAHVVPVRILLDRAEDQRHFRAYRVLWTPTIAIIDRRGASHYQSPGYLPPAPFLSALRIGMGRALAAWSRYDEAALHLSAVAESGDQLLAPEALYWLGTVWYLQTRRRAPMMRAWRQLRAEYPDSAWAARIPPNQEEDD